MQVFRIRFIALFFSVVVLNSAVNETFIVEHKYPNYAYVFSEFDVDESYVYNDEFIRFVMKHEHGLKKFYKRSLRRGEEILPMMQGLLVEDGVSDLFIYLSMIESGFIIDAVSPKKAVGLWQFMPATARHYNLTVCSTYDERCDSVSATSAAIRYLNKLYKQFGKWYLAAMAYNCGEGCVDKAIKRAKTDDLAVLVNNDSKFLPKETRDYIKKILLIAMIGEDNTFCMTSEKNNDEEIIYVEIDESSSLADIAGLLKMDIKKLLTLNKGLQNSKILNKQKRYKIIIPLEKMYAFYLRYDMPILDSEKQDKKIKSDINYKSHMVTHRVVMGDTLQNLAKYYDTEVDVIRVANHLEYTFLTVDDLLVIPVNKKIFDKLSNEHDTIE
jgi:membrane-bound lytic murein transglycosylase D